MRGGGTGIRGGGGMPLRPLGDAREMAQRRFDRVVIRRAWGLARPYRRRLVGFLLVIVAGAAVAATPPQLARLALDDAIPGGDRGLLWLLFGAMLVVALTVAALSMTERFLSSSIGEGLILDLRTMLYRHVQAMPIAFFTRTQTGSLITRLNNDVIGAQRALTGTLGGIVDNLIGVTVTLVAMMILEWRVTLLAMVLLPGFVIPARIVGRRLQQLSRRSMELNAEMNTVMTERFHVAGALLVKLFGRIDREVDVFHDRAAQVAHLGVRTAIHGRALFASLGFVGASAVALVYLVGGHLHIADPTLGVGTIVALAMYVTQLYGPLAQLSNARVDLMAALVSFERVFEVLDLPHSIREQPDARELVNARGHVRFDRVSFRYPSAEGTSLASLEGPRTEHGTDASDWILHDIHLDVAPGTMVAVVGPSGAGKSTLSSLLPRLYDVTEGRVLVDGTDVRDLTLDSLRGAIGVVSQDAHLFHDSIAANLRYARPDATDDELVAAATAARIHHVIQHLPDGYDTVVGERGHRMSGGEKQRLSIARVLLKNPAIVILDEATAHLDTESERLVQAALAEALRDRTSLVIAHRLSTVIDADVIVVLEGGRIVEQGGHAELLAAGGIYADLARTQLVSPASSEPVSPSPSDTD
ncbi:MAG: ABC transporter ATP-binding protein [Nitriliruptoraceae bacterium]